MKKLNLLLVGIALAIKGTAPAHAEFTAVQPPPVEGGIALETPSFESCRNLGGLILIQFIRPT
jgi:hypothetical protein